MFVGYVTKKDISKRKTWCEYYVKPPHKRNISNSMICSGGNFCEPCSRYNECYQKITGKKCIA